MLQELSMRSFTRVCVELSVLLAAAAATGLVSGWALPLAGLIFVLAALTILIERESRAGPAADAPQEPPSEVLDHEAIPAPPAPEPEPAAPAAVAPSMALVAYEAPGGLDLLVPPLSTTTFRLPDVGQAEAVWLVGDFNDWSPSDHPMERVGGAWVTSVVVERGRSYRYRYLLDGNRWENDWAADAYLPNGFGGEDSVLDLTDR